MIEESTGISQRAYARLAGFMYLFVLVVDLSGLPLISKTENEHTVGQCCMFLGSLCTIPLAIGLYGVLKSVNRGLALAALSCRLVEAGLGLLKTLLAFTAIRLQVQSTHFGDQLNRLNPISIDVLAFGIGSTIFFYLFWRARYIPKIMSLWGIFASAIVVISCVYHLLQPDYAVMSPGYLWVPMLVAEISTGLWLLIRAIDIQAVRRRSLDPASA